MVPATKGRIPRSLGAAPNFDPAVRPMGFAFVALCQVKSRPLNFVRDVCTESEWVSPLFRNFGFDTPVPATGQKAGRVKRPETCVRNC